MARLFFLLIFGGLPWTLAVAGSVASSTPPDWAWTVNVPGARGFAVATDASGNVYITGGFGATVAFGTTNLTAESRGDLFVAKVDPSGQFVWVAQARGSSDASVSGQAIALDSNGNIYVGGRLYDEVNFGPTNLNSGYFTWSDAFLAKYDSAGRCQWAWQGNSRNDPWAYCSAVAVDSNDDVIISGHYKPGIFCEEGGCLLTNWHDAFVAKFNGAGHVQWSRDLGGGTWNEANALAIDQADNVYMTGYFSRESGFGSSRGVSDIYVAKYNSGGELQWARQAGAISDGNDDDDSYDDGLGVVVDRLGGVYVTGSFAGGEVTFGETNLLGGTRDFFLAKYDSAGDLDWVRKGYGTLGTSMAIDGAGDVYTTVSPPFIHKYDAAGNLLWSKDAGPGLGFVDAAITVAPDGSKYITTDYVFLRKLDSAGTGPRLNMAPSVPVITYPNQAYTFANGIASPVPGAFNVKAVAIEGDMVLAVTRDGRVVTSGIPDHWLDGIREQLTNIVSVGLNYTMGGALTADGRVIQFARVPEEQPPGLTNVIALDVAGQFFDDDLDYRVAVTSDGRAVTWGYYGFPPSTNFPGLVTAAGGWSHVVGLKSDGTVVQWPDQPAIVATLSNIVAVAAGGEHSLALKADGTVVAWGDNQFGQSDVPAGLSNVVAISAAEDHTLALKRDGTLAAWGRSYFGGPVTPPANLSNVLAIASSGTRNIAICALPVPPPITYPNQAYMFANGSFSPVPGFTNIKAFATEREMALGVTHDGRIITHNIPDHWFSNIVDRLTNVVAVGLSYVQAAALTADGRVIDLEVEPRWPVPPEVTNIIAFDVFGQAGDDDLDHKLAVTSDGRVIVWGSYGIPPPPDLSGVISAAGGWSHVVALKGDGTVTAWGDNTHGQLDIPPGLHSVVAVAAGGEHSVALKADGTVVAWGENREGQLDIPAGLSNVVAIAAAEELTLALKRDGTLAAWGKDYYGGSVTPPAGLSNVVAIAVSGNANLALVTFPPSRSVLGITANAPTSGRLTLTLSGDPNKVYAVESSADLLTWHFVQHITNQTGSTSIELGNTNAQQFFRAE